VLWLSGHPLNFTVYVPSGLLQVLDVLVFLPRTPQVLDRCADVVGHVLDDVDALYPTRVLCVVARVVDGVMLRSALAFWNTICHDVQYRSETRLCTCRTSSMYTSGGGACSRKFPVRRDVPMSPVVLHLSRVLIRRPPRDRAVGAPALEWRPTA
jgi:hypothetical protein